MGSVKGLFIAQPLASLHILLKMKAAGSLFSWYNFGLDNSDKETENE